ncbi:hypothetical protein NP493_154g03000 [Ridgeia piscesae]|uniref:Uncharacterized protein n=1 Tax=Ridgeia piscesae TaxID=27915 RepID=A0AAD9UFR1_RIDPI|nr:hypothetical protein NP493_154g03000 [Ridgeia piscesae]
MAVDFVRVRGVTHAGIATPPRSRSSGQDGRSSFEVVRCLTFLWHFKSFHLKWFNLMFHHKRSPLSASTATRPSLLSPSHSMKSQSISAQLQALGTLPRMQLR